ncbi:hypothetical protein HYPBUDRAFT_151876 [Hyphopichia burtonii NRRL Y-1933]|uniref:Calcipressin n=1 Tax=Hyphopichia burtonii NRRL Y-1933 TaxID=984485 RepID=A0A1E4RM84_9ASCO|nr:hypothetical protein HYPBUDRAFT_151876 [Hyphopichia burtonii NRRL Y-1933]ODV68380.1 hypothetical protein HYPBUDRAFT_151876 [Hyphopichia burtonii NRRL Y-1933]
MPRNPTNTLIITHLPGEIIQDPTPLLKDLAVDNSLLELISLPKFNRILIICESSQLAIHIRHMLKSSSNWNYLRITYSIRDNQMSITSNPHYLIQQDSKQYLELPLELGSRRFLISPPLSPPAEWDHWDKVEEGPSNKTFPTDELTNLLWERLGGFDSSQVRKYQDYSDNESLSSEDNDYTHHAKDNLVVDLNMKPEVLFEDIDNGVPAIVLDTVNNRGPHTLSAKLRPPKTSLPPLN